MPFQRALHLDAVAIIRGYKVWADEQENDVGGIEMRVYLLLPFLSCTNVAVVPIDDESLSLQRVEMFPKLIPQFLIFMGIGVEDIQRTCRLCCHQLRSL